MSWIPDVAGDWMNKSAEKYATKAVGRGPVFTRNPALMETAGALLWALQYDLGISSREAFVTYMTQACGWTAVNIDRAAGEIEVKCASKEAWAKIKEALGKKPSAEARTIPLFPGEPSLNLIVDGLRAKGIRHFSLIDISQWSVIKRDVAREWLKQGGETPDFLTACNACERNEPFIKGKEYLHTCEGPTCRACGGSKFDSDATDAPCQVCSGSGELQRADTCPTCLGAGCDEDGVQCEHCRGTGKWSPTSEEPVKRGRGRPPGSRNKKLTKAWQAVKDALAGPAA